nr:glycosyltransferase [Lachnospiraceae bacterium]
MPLLSARNIKRTYGYLKRNGLKAAIDAAMEETSAVIKEDYDYIPPSESELTRQRELSAFKGGGLKFSIVVPAYNTDPGFFRELIVSCLDQTYPYFELIIADASTEDNVKNIVEGFTADPATAQSAKRIKYFRLPENLGISGNTNKAIERAKGDYIVFLDHDDLLTPDALYEVAAA